MSKAIPVYLLQKTWVKIGAGSMKKAFCYHKKVDNPIPLRLPQVEVPKKCLK